MCFQRLQDEINSPSSIYRDAHGNRVRVVGSVFQPLASVVLKGAKDNPVRSDTQRETMLLCTCIPLHYLTCLQISTTF
jgi:hypothetical protein